MCRARASRLRHVGRRPAAPDREQDDVVARVVVALDVQVARRLRARREDLERDVALDQARARRRGRGRRAAGGRGPTAASRRGGRRRARRLVQGPRPLGGTVRRRVRCRAEPALRPRDQRGGRRPATAAAPTAADARERERARCRARSALSPRASAWASTRTTTGYSRVVVLGRPAVLVDHARVLGEERGVRRGGRGGRDRCGPRPRSSRRRRPRHRMSRLKRHERPFTDVVVAGRPLAGVDRHDPIGPQEPDGRALRLPVGVDRRQPADPLGARAARAPGRRPASPDRASRSSCVRAQVEAQDALLLDDAVRRHEPVALVERLRRVPPWPAARPQRVRAGPRPQVRHDRVEGTRCRNPAAGQRSSMSRRHR